MPTSGAAARREGSPAEDRGPAAGTPPPTARTTQERRRGGFFPLLLGGIVAALIGGAVMWYFAEQGVIGAAGPDEDLIARLDATDTRFDEIDAGLSDLRQQVDGLSRAVSAGDVAGEVEALRAEADGRFVDLDETVAGLAAQIDEVGTRLGAMDTGIGELTSRTEDLEARPVADPGEQQRLLESEIDAIREQAQQAASDVSEEVDAMRAELAAAAEEARSEVDAMRAELERAAADAQAEAEAAEERAAQLQAEAEAAARRAEARAALGLIEAAIANGTEFVEPLGELQAALETEVPSPLPEVAGEGVATLAELRRGYPDAARDALAAAAVVETTGDPLDRIASFIRVQTQARSLEPRRGDDPDAILSRAEAALEDGDLDAALAELDTLPEDARAAMGGWLEEARQRAAAQAAVRDLMQVLN